MERFTVNRSQLLFLTGCINPKGMLFTQLQNEEDRRNQYLEAIRFYLDKTALPLLFVENSGTDITPYFASEIESRRLEILTFEGNNYPRELGKGYGEMLIIQHALNHSVLISEYNFILKITGRIKILNIRSVLKQFYSVNEKQVYVNFHTALSYADSKCWGADKGFYQDYLTPYQPHLNDSTGFYFEHALSKAVHQAIIDDFKFSFISTLPRYSGISGTSNNKYKDSIWYWFPRFLRHKLRAYLVSKSKY
jgi:hypothetical protein